MAKLNGVKTIDMVNGEITKVEYGGEVYAKVDNVSVPIEWDVGMITEEDVSSYTKGAFYGLKPGLTSLGSFGTLSDDHGSTTNGLGAHCWAVFRKQSSPSLDERVSVLETKVAELEGEADETIEQRIAHNGAEYKLVDRKAQPGDVVVFTGSHANYIKNYKSYGPVSSAVWFIDEEGDELPVYTEESDRTPSNVKVYEPVALKVGDYAKVICEKHGHKFSNGDIVELVGDGYNPEFMALRITDNKGWFVSSEEIIRATDEEVAEAERQAEKAAIEAKWASIGRKPGEFKKGDIVRLTQDTGANEKGEIVTLAEDDADYYYDEEGDVYGCDASWVELITPVESRFDHA